MYFAITTTVEHQPRGENMVSAMVTVMTQVFFFDSDRSQVQCLLGDEDPLSSDLSLSGRLRTTVA